MRRVGRPQAQVDDIHGLFAAPLQRADDGLDGGAQAPVEDFDRVEVGVRRPLPDRARPRPHGAVARGDPAIHNRDLYTAIASHWPMVMVWCAIRASDARCVIRMTV